MRVLVCGSRTFSDRGFLYRELNAFDKDIPITLLIVGGARGADTFARDWAEIRGIPFQEFKADWKTYGKGAGPIRNKQMLKEGKPERVIAFIDRPLTFTKGTKSMIVLAEKGNVPFLIKRRIFTDHNEPHHKESGIDYDFEDM